MVGQPGRCQEEKRKWRICVDFTDPNMACPKDSYPLPRIDRLVESTAVNELLTFIDAFSGYNKIMMHQDDREKTAFITDRGTYCYKVMPKDVQSYNNKNFTGLRTKGLRETTTTQKINLQRDQGLLQRLELRLGRRLRFYPLSNQVDSRLRQCFLVP